MKYFYLLFIVFNLITVSVFADGAIEGVVQFDGEKPKFSKLRMDADPICLMHQKGDVFPETLVLGKDNGIANVIVSIKEVPKKDYPLPQEDIVINQQGCNYSPHVNIVRVGQKVKILNPDGTLHNVHSISKVNREFNIAMPKFRTEYEHIFTKVEAPFQLKCDVHPWMLAWIRVTDHPFVVLTNQEGNFKIENLPAGNYTVEIWHERLGLKSETVLVKEGEVTPLNVRLSKTK